MENIKFNIDDFWDRVKNLCKENYATLKDFSVQIGLAPRAIENQRQTKANPKLEQLINMAYYFDVSLDYLITGLQTLPSKSSQEKTKQLTANIKARLDTKNFRLSQSLEARTKDKKEDEVKSLRSKIEEIKELSSL